MKNSIYSLLAFSILVVAAHHSFADGSRFSGSDLEVYKLGLKQGESQRQCDQLTQPGRVGINPVPNETGREHMKRLNPGQHIAPTPSRDGKLPRNYN